MPDPRAPADFARLVDIRAFMDLRARKSIGLRQFHRPRVVVLTLMVLHRSKSCFHHPRSIPSGRFPSPTIGRGRLTSCGSRPPEKPVCGKGLKTRRIRPQPGSNASTCLAYPRQRDARSSRGPRSDRAARRANSHWHRTAHEGMVGHVERNSDAEQ
jgi:hypothetical protein